MVALSLPSLPSSPDVNKWIYKSTAPICLYSLHKDKFLFVFLRDLSRRNGDYWNNFLSISVNWLAMKIRENRLDWCVLYKWQSCPTLLGWRGGRKPQPLLWTDSQDRRVIITESSVRNGLNYSVIFIVFIALKFLRETLRNRGVRRSFVTSLLMHCVAIYELPFSSNIEALRTGSVSGSETKCLCLESAWRSVSFTRECSKGDNK